MAEANTPPAGGITLEQVNAAIAAATAPLLAALKPVGEAVAALGTQVAELKKAPEVKKDAADAGKPLSADDVKQLVASGVKETLTAFTTSQQQAQARQSYIDTKLKDVSEKLPELLGTLGNDPAKFAEQEQAIRGTFKSRMEALGVKAADVSGKTEGGKPAGAAVDTSKLSGFELLTLATKDQKPLAGGVAVPADVATVQTAAAAK
jgi:hypothetical protein